MTEPESDPGFTFVDRRRRSQEEPAAEGQVSPPPPAPPRRADEAPPAAAPRRTEEPPPPRPATGQADLTALLTMLYGDALVHLGQVPDPVSGQPTLDLEQARFVIDLLAMVKARTEGNRTPRESALLDEMLAALRLGFVQLSRRA